MSDKTPPVTFACVMLSRSQAWPKWLRLNTNEWKEAVGMMSRRDREGWGDVLAVKIGEHVHVLDDMGAREDMTFNRDLGWVPQLIRKAYEQGVADERARASNVADATWTPSERL